MNLNEYGEMCHKANQKWWPSDVRTRNKGEAIALMHSELSEALEGERKNLMDDHLPDRPAAEVELADCLIRIFDYAYAFGYDLEGAFQDKMKYNATREDHKLENRMKENGKKF